MGLFSRVAASYSVHYYSTPSLTPYIYLSVEVIKPVPKEVEVCRKQPVQRKSLTADMYHVQKSK